jgi:hypothetical protein
LCITNSSIEAKFPPFHIKDEIMYTNDSENQRYREAGIAPFIVSQDGSTALF